MLSIKSAYADEARQLTAARLLLFSVEQKGFDPGAQHERSGIEYRTVTARGNHSDGSRTNRPLLARRLLRWAHRSAPSSRRAALKKCKRWCVRAENEARPS